MDDFSFLEELGSLLALYRDVVKPLLAEVEAEYEKFPIPIYNEARAFLDHISRCVDEAGVVNGNSEYVRQQLISASHHVKRMILDCYKLLNIASKQKVERFEEMIKRLDLRTMDGDGSFSAEYHRLKREAILLVQKAKSVEASGTDDDIYKAFEHSHNAYCSLLSFIQVNEGDIARARYRNDVSKLVHAIWVGVSFVLGSLLSGYTKEIVSTVITWLKRLV